MSLLVGKMPLTLVLQATLSCSSSAGSAVQSAVLTVFAELPFQIGIASVVGSLCHPSSAADSTQAVHM